MGSIAPPRPAPRHAAPRPAAAAAAGRSSGRWIIVPKTSERHRQREAFKRAQVRRRRWFGLLLVAAIGTAAGAFVYGETWLEIHLLADGFLFFYAAFLFETKRRRQERAAKVRRIDASLDGRGIEERIHAGSQSI